MKTYAFAIRTVLYEVYEIEASSPHWAEAKFNILADRAELGPAEDSRVIAEEREPLGQTTPGAGMYLP